MTLPRFALASFAVALLLSPVVAAEKDRGEELERAKKHLAFLAGPECEGRGLQTKGIKKAGEYIADEFKAAGLKPAFKDGYFQPFEVPGQPQMSTPMAASIRTATRTVELAFKASYIPTFASAPGNAKAELVFAGYGVTSQHPKYDDYDGMDVKGKVVVVLRRLPGYDQGEKGPFGADNPLASFVSKIQNATAHGAAGILFVSDETLAKEGDKLITPEQTLPAAMSGPVLHVRRNVIDTLLEAKQTTLAQLEAGILKEVKPYSFTLDATLETELTFETPKYATRNVVAVCDGAGPLADETVVIGAHYDHLGYGEGGSLPQNSGQVHYGADDNGSGTTGLLALARRYGAVKERQGRRIVFIAFSGEEQGLHGSKAYCKAPAFPLDKTAFMINLDMIGRLVQQEDKAAGGKMRDRIVVYGTGTTTGLEKLVDDANKAFDFKLLKVPGGQGPSDHTSFYNKGVPVLFLFTGTHKDYHRPSDTPEKINADGLLKVADYVQVFADHFATVKEKPDFTPTKGGEEDPTNPDAKVSRVNVPRLGMMPDNYGEDGLGVLVGGVTKDGPAEKGGVKVGDYIVEVGGKPVRNMGTYMTAMGSVKPGTEVEIVVNRKDKKVTLKVTPIK